MIPLLAQRLSQLRKENNKTQKQVAEFLKITRPAYTAYEGGSREPDYETLQKLADYFMVTTDYLLGRTDNRDGNADNNKLNKYKENEFDPLAIIKAYLEKKGGADQFGFFNIDEWKDLTPEQVEDVLEDIDYMFRKAKKRNEDKK